MGASALDEGVLEGATRLFPPVPTDPRQRPERGPALASGPFYNPAMARNRDLSVLLVAAFGRRKARSFDVADVLAGIGARALRIAQESDADVVVHANDADPKALNALRRAATANGVVDRLRVHHGSAHLFLSRARHDIVDVDPYGAPTPFLDAAVRATRHDGLVCLTATDTAALCGTYPRTCRRRYGAQQRLHRHPWRAEVGLRILAAAAVRAAGRLDRGARPVLCVGQGHWMRVVLRVSDRRTDAERAAEQVGWAYADRHGLGHLTDRPGDLPTAWAGPLWTGDLHEPDFVQDLQEVARGPRPWGDPGTPALVDRLAQEAGAPPFWIRPDDLHVGGRAPRRDRLAAALREAGFRTARTHLDPAGLRTDAPWEELVRLADLPTKP